MVWVMKDLEKWLEGPEVGDQAGSWFRTLSREEDTKEGRVTLCVGGGFKEQVWQWQWGLL